MKNRTNPLRIPSVCHRRTLGPMDLEVAGALSASPAKRVKRKVIDRERGRASWRAQVSGRQRNSPDGVVRPELPDLHLPGHTCQTGDVVAQSSEMIHAPCLGALEGVAVVDLEDAVLRGLVDSRGLVEAGAAL